MKLFHWIDRFFGHRWVRREEFDFTHPPIGYMIAHQCAWCGTIKLTHEGSPGQLMWSRDHYSAQRERNKRVSEGLEKSKRGG